MVFCISTVSDDISPFSFLILHIGFSLLDEYRERFINFVYTLKIPVLDLSDFSFFIFFFKLRLYLWHVEVSGLEIELELRLLAYTTATQDLSCICNLNHSSWKLWILSQMSKARYQTCFLMNNSRIHLH